MEHVEFLTQYGAHVFHTRAMSHYLDPEELASFIETTTQDRSLTAHMAQKIAWAVRQWACAQGATHYCHWFQPQTGVTAEKHDAFLSFNHQGEAIEHLGASHLLQSEPDASSFPSGGARSTFEARGYTNWDPKSPMFLLKSGGSTTLYIPSVFVSYDGESLDFKMPLLRSNAALSESAVETLRILGIAHIDRVHVALGIEQEFFLIPRELAHKRLDVTSTGRTLFGIEAPKGQELEDHYLSSMPERVQRFMRALENELYPLGIPLKTRHNEVAPGQFEIAPLYEECNLAADHNQLLMQCMPRIAEQENLCVLFHEKPFQGINGSGKHVNWSLCDSNGINLLDPGPHPANNHIFLAFLAGILLGLKDHAAVLRATVACASNDERLGEHEAPPAIFSVFLGHAVHHLLNDIQSGAIQMGQSETENKSFIHFDVAYLAPMKQDDTDRNRTSPFAFTGNRFEFRSVGASASVSYPVAVLNAIVCDGLQQLNRRLRAALETYGPWTSAVFFRVLQTVFLETQAIRFEGDGYSRNWQKQAEERGLPHIPHTPAALALVAQEESVQFLYRTGVFTSIEWMHRCRVFETRYIQQRCIEARCALEMAQCHILPACIRHATVLFENVHQAQCIHVASPVVHLAHSFSDLVRRLIAAIEHLRHQYESITRSIHTPLEKCTDLVTQLLPSLAVLRAVVDEAEHLVPDWPYPRYADLLYF